LALALITGPTGGVGIIDGGELGNVMSWYPPPVSHFCCYLLFYFLFSLFHFLQIIFTPRKKNFIIRTRVLNSLL
jgi:hypothetical protein